MSSINTLASPALTRRVPGREQARDAFRTSRLLIEFGICWVLFEAVLRRAYPDFNTKILAFKFGFFPLLYVFFWPRLRQFIHYRYWPSGIIFYLAWGVVLTVSVDWMRPVVGGLGILIGTLFTPVAFLGAAYYTSRQSADRLLWRFTLVCGMIGALAMFQSLLSPDHWLNMSMDWEANNIGMGGLHYRVSSSFQFCNVFSSFVVLGVVICYGTFRRAITLRRKQIAASCLVIIYLGGLNSGSRVASIGSLLVLVCCVFADRDGKKNAMYMVVAMCFFIAALAIVWPQRVADHIALGGTRTFSVSGLSDRVQDIYLDETMVNAWEVGQGLGAGWGNYTLGVERYAMDEQTVVPLPYVEGGYAVVLAQTGVVGLALFCYFNLSLLVYSLRNRTEWSWMGVGLATWPILGNIPFQVHQASVLAIPWWLLIGVYLRQQQLSLKHARSPRPLGASKQLSIRRASPSNTNTH